MNLATLTDEELMEALQKGKTEAFEILFKKYQSPVFNFLTRQLGNRDTAADLTQDVFAKIIRNASSFQHKSRFSTWIYTVARNGAVDILRKASHRRHASLDSPTGEDGPTLGERIAGDQPAPDRQTTAGRLRNALSEAIESLPVDQREIFLLRQYHGMPFQEIAEVVNAPVGTVKSRMRYALESLRGSLSDYEDYARTLS